MKSYFFVPASRLNKLPEIKELRVDEIIIDFEDAILSSNFEKYFKELKKLNDLDSYWFRVPLRTDFNVNISLDVIEKFKSIGVQNLVLPKIQSAFELIQIIKHFKDLNFILLVEHPRFLLEIKYVLMNNTEVIKSIFGIGLGSHDLMTFLKSKHNPEQLDYPRKEVLYLAKAYDLQAIDIASMNISNEEFFTEEVKYGEDAGYDGKFLIHPKQMLWLQSQLKQKSNLLAWAQNVLNHLPQNYKGGSIAPFILNGEIIEKPHALRALEIIKKYNYEK